MTEVTLHGALGKKFGKNFKLKVSNAFSALKGIDANRNGFMRKILSLNKNGESYCIIVDGEVLNEQNQLREKRKINKIDVIPLIYGYGPIGSILLNIVISIGIQFLINALMKQATPQDPQLYVSVGGNVSSVETSGKSYVFSNRQNVAEQGSSIPVGYGRTKINSKIILNSIKNYSTSMVFREEAYSNISQQIAFYNDFLST
jgi:predicted phage tail protein